MDSRVDFQRLVESFDQMIQAKRQELAELDEQLEVARGQLSEKEAKELNETIGQTDYDSMPIDTLITKQQLDQLVDNQRISYEQQLDKITDAMSQFEHRNQNLAKENEEFRSRLAKKMSINQKLTKDVYTMMQELEEVRRANFELNIRLAKAEKESQLQQKLLKRTHQEDEVLMTAFKAKLESLRKSIEFRDKEIERLVQENDKTALTASSIDDKKDIVMYLQEIGLANVQRQEDDGEEVELIVNSETLFALVDLLKKRDQHIKVLKSQLNQATKDLDQNSSIIDSILANGFDDINLITSGLNWPATKDTKDMGATQINASSQIQQALVDKCRSLESELEVKDEQLHNFELRNREIERILPEQLTTLLAKLSYMMDLFIEAKDNNHVSDVESLKMIADIRTKLGLILETHRGVQKLLDDNERLRIIISKRDAQIRSLAQELSRNHAKLNDDDYGGDENEIATQVNSSSDAQFEVRGGSEEHQNKNVQKVVGRNQESQLGRNNDSVSPNVENSYTTERETKFEDKTTETGNQVELSESSTQTSLEIANSYQEDKISELEREIELFELAMREILVSIKWTDSQCVSLSLDCPSLERFCLLIESRFMATKPIALALDDLRARTRDSKGVDQVENEKDLPGRIDASHLLFQMIVLKSELDLVRGQNEQLRADLKLERRDYIDRMNCLKENLEEEANDSEVKFRMNEVECQTEIDSRSDSSQSGNPMIQEAGCKTCTRFSKLTSHLMQAIIRIEDKVNMSDENYANRLKNFHTFMRMQQRDLTLRDIQLNDARQKFQTVTRQKNHIEAQLKQLQQNQSVKQVATVPKAHHVAAANESRFDEHKFNINTLTTINHHHHIKSSPNVQFNPLRPVSRPLDMPITGNPKMTISLLQSIIKCLQTRLEHKDLCLRNLENLMLRQGNDSSISSDSS